VPAVTPGTATVVDPPETLAIAPVPVPAEAPCHPSNITYRLVEAPEGLAQRPIRAGYHANVP
jgi:hypothetical protein